MVLPNNSPDGLVQGKNDVFADFTEEGAGIGYSAILAKDLSGGKKILWNVGVSCGVGLEGGMASVTVGVAVGVMKPLGNGFSLEAKGIADTNSGIGGGTDTAYNVTGTAGLAYSNERLSVKASVQGGLSGQGHEQVSWSSVRVEGALNLNNNFTIGAYAQYAQYAQFSNGDLGGLAPPAVGDPAVGVRGAFRF